MKLIIRWRPFALLAIVLLGLLLRLYGINWDQGNSFHPDERQIMFHVTTLSWPKSFAQFLNPTNSPLNPHFFAYGSFPFYVLASLGNILSHFFPAITTFQNLTLLGRFLSALFDTGTILLMGVLALRLITDHTPGRRYAWNVALLVAALVAFTPFQIQLSHFYAVDTMLLFFVVLTILACVVLIDTEQQLLWALLVGVGYGLGMATKFSAAPLAVPLFVACVFRWQRHGFVSALLALLVASLSSIVIFLIAEPYALLDTTNYVQQVTEQGQLARGLLDYPYIRQFAGTIPYVYEARNIFFWGLGVMLGLGVCLGVVWLVWRLWRQRKGEQEVLEVQGWVVILSWVLIFSGIVGDFYVKFMRYMLPIYPFLTLIAAAALVAFARWLWYLGEKRGKTSTLQAAASNVSPVPSSFSSHTTVLHSKRAVALRAVGVGAIVLVLGGTMFQGLALLNVYSVPNTRIQASLWMYQHLAPRSVLTYEQWDDPLPVAIAGYDPSEFVQLVYPDAQGQPVTGLDLYGDDTLAKAQLLARVLPTVNAITMPTDRLDKSIPRLPARYPLTIHYYQLLFSGQLGFHLAAQFENRPHLFGITLNDSGADESYSVFDHPTARIFVRDTPYPYTSAQLLQKLLQGVQLPSS